jgi:hypothetical protein
MFNKDNFKQIGVDIYVYPNFMSPEESDSVTSYLDSLGPEDYWQPHAEKRFKVKEEKGVKSLEEIRSRIKSLLHEGYHVGTNTHPHKLLKGTKRYPHSDKEEFVEASIASSLYVDGDEFDYADCMDMGMYLFFNDFEGGEFYYDAQDITYKPSKGDLIFHSPEDHCKHSTKEVLSEKYYAWPNHIYHMIKVPKGYVPAGHPLTNSMGR